MSIRLGPWCFAPRPLPSLAVALLLALLLALGVWQLQRGAMKAALLDAWRGYADASPVALDTLDGDARALHLRPVSAAGALDGARQLLLDNRTRGGHAGYEVLVPLRFAGGMRGVLVNRGWLARGPRRADKPVLAPPPRGEVRVHGVAHVPGDAFRLGAMLEPGSGWPHIVQFVDFAAISTLLGYELLPVTLRLDAADAMALAADWQPVASGPERHYGYAVQWFALALALLVIYFVTNLRRIR